MNYLRWRKIKKSISNGKALAKPAAMEFYLTDICNLTCLHCNVWTRPGKQPLSYSQIANIFRELRYLGVKYVGYTGGEPLLHRDYRKIIRLGSKSGFQQHTTTNATILTKDLARDMALYSDTVGVSIDGIGPVFETIRRTKWSLVERGLNLLLDAKANVSLGMVLTAKNIDDAWNVMDYADEKGLDVGFQPYNKWGVVMPKGELWTDSDLALNENEHSDLLREIAEHALELNPEQTGYYAGMWNYAIHDQKSTDCYISFDKFVLEANGDVRPCHIFPIVGSALKSSISELWFSPRYNELRREMVSCRKCYLGCYEHLNVEINRRLTT